VISFGYYHRIDREVRERELASMRIQLARLALSCRAISRTSAAAMAASRSAATAASRRRCDPIQTFPINADRTGRA